MRVIGIDPGKSGFLAYLGDAGQVLCWPTPTVPMGRAARREYDVPGIDVLVNVVVVALLQGSSFVLTLAVFLLIYKFMPNTRTYWRYIWPGAVVGAVLFEAAKNLFIVYLSRFASFENVYGSLTPVIVLLLWAYISALILILGAELSSEYGRMRHGVARGLLLHPRHPTSSRGSGI